MTKEDFIKQITKIQTAYNKSFTQNELRLWFNNFEKMNIKDFGIAVDKTIKELTFMPKIADIVCRIENNSATDPYAYLYKNNQWAELVKGE